MGRHISNEDFDREEALRYQPGQRVELKSRPGVVDIIADYDPMMVPPIWLANDPKPRYPHELNVLPKSVIGSMRSHFSRPRRLAHPACKARLNVATVSK